MGTWAGRRFFVTTGMAGAFCIFSVVMSGAAWATPVEQVIFDHVEYQGNWGPGISKAVTLPAAAVMRKFDTMSITLTLGCIDKVCPPWDFVANLNLCTGANGTACNTEIGRWVTPYGAGGTWTTQADQMLALLRKGGAQTFYFWTPQPYTLTIKLTFDNKNKGRVPISATPLFRGGRLNARLQRAPQADQGDHRHTTGARGDLRHHNRPWLGRYRRKLRRIL
jgi:hypothetical protein